MSAFLSPALCAGILILKILTVRLWHAPDATHQAQLCLEKIMRKDIKWEVETAFPPRADM